MSLNILAVLPLYPPKSRVGAWITTHEYLAALADRGHTVDVLQLSTPMPDYLLDGVHVHGRHFEHGTPDLVISHLGDQHQGARYAAKVDVPSVRFVHGYDHQNAEKLDQTPTALAIFSSQALASDTAWDGPQLVAHPPVFAARYTTTPGHLVTLSNLSEAKGGELLKYLALTLHDVEFLGVRGGHGRQVQPMPPNVTVVNPAEDVRNIYTRTGILLMPSDRESYGRVGVEAACSGIPTIAHPSPGLVEALGDAATWVDRTNLAGWTEAVRRLSQPAEWVRASTRARHAIQSDPEGTVERVTNAVEQTVKVVA